MQNSNISMVQVNSSSISALGYNKESAVLRVVFRNGSVYEYNHIPESLFLGFFTLAVSTDIAGNTNYQTKSIGKYFHAQIKTKEHLYPFTRI
jgi:hypothetical protein